jgi:hypothetical protein
MEYTPRRKLAREFKLEAVRQAALSEKPKAQLARELGVRVGRSRTTVRRFKPPVARSWGRIFGSHGALSSSDARAMVRARGSPSWPALPDFLGS